jgi:hypothetical protein
MTGRTGENVSTHHLPWSQRTRPSPVRSQAGRDAARARRRVATATAIAGFATGLAAISYAVGTLSWL